MAGRLVPSPMPRRRGFDFGRVVLPSAASTPPVVAALQLDCSSSTSTVSTADASSAPPNAASGTPTIDGNIAGSRTTELSWPRSSDKVCRSRQSSRPRPRRLRCGEARVAANRRSGLAASDATFACTGRGTDGRATAAHIVAASARRERNVTTLGSIALPLVARQSPPPDERALTAGHHAPRESQLAACPTLDEGRRVASRGPRLHRRLGRIGSDSHIAWTTGGFKTAGEDTSEGVGAAATTAPLARTRRAKRAASARCARSAATRQAP